MHLHVKNYLGVITLEKFKKISMLLTSITPGYIQQLVNEHTLFYGDKINELKRDINYLERIVSAPIQDSDEALSDANPELKQRFLTSQAQLIIDCHIMSYVFNELTGSNGITQLDKARKFLSQMQETRIATGVR